MESKSFEIQYPDPRGRKLLRAMRKCYKTQSFLSLMFPNSTRLVSVRTLKHSRYVRRSWVLSREQGNYVLSAGNVLHWLEIWHHCTDHYAAGLSTSLLPVSKALQRVHKESQFTTSLYRLKPWRNLHTGHDRLIFQTLTFSFFKIISSSHSTT
jgi:hypothetical protein